MTNSEFIYVTYIRTTPEKLWTALTNVEFMKQYWFGMHCECDWKAGSSWKLVFADGRIADAGEVVEVDPPRRLVLKWRNEWNPEMAPQATVMNAKGNTLPPNTGPRPLVNCVNGGISAGGCIATMPSASAIIVPILMNAER